MGSVLSFSICDLVEIEELVVGGGGVIPIVVSAVEGGWGWDGFVWRGGVFPVCSGGKWQSYHADEGWG